MPQGFTPRRAFDEEFYRRTLNAGIAAVKGKDFAEARFLLRKAAEMKPTDPQPWLWLSATTQDPKEQKEYLEYALAADPHNGAARRGLAILSGKLDRSRLLAEGEEVQARQSKEPLEAQAEQVFRCEQCGGRMRYEVSKQWLICEHCGTRRQLPLASVADEAEQVLDFVLPTSRGHTWAEARHRFACNQCGAISLLESKERAVTCFLVNWSVLAYDHSLAEASLDARERVAKRLRQTLPQKVLPGQEKRNLQGGAPEWSGMTYKLVLYPFYVGHYSYRGKSYHLFVNAHNGKVSGEKPADWVKQTAFFLIAALGVILLFLAIYLIASSFGWFGLLPQSSIKIAGQI